MLGPHNLKIRDVTVHGDDVTFFFEEFDQPWGVIEFEPNSPTRRWLEKIEDAIFEGPLPDIPTRWQRLKAGLFPWPFGGNGGVHARKVRKD